MMGDMKAAAIQRAAQQMDSRESEMAQRVTWEFALLEYQQAAAAADLADAAGLDLDVDVPDPDARQNELLDAVDAATGQEFPEWWWSTIAPERMDNAESAASLAGADGETWREQIDDWCHRYHDAGIIETPPEEMDAGDRARLVAQHVEEAHDLSVREFVRDVINWDARLALRGFLAGRTQTHTAVMREVADRLDGGDA